MIAASILANAISNGAACAANSFSNETAAHAEGALSR